MYREKDGKGISKRKREFFFFQEEDGKRVLVRSRGVEDVIKDRISKTITGINSRWNVLSRKNNF